MANSVEEGSSPSNERRGGGDSETPSSPVLSFLRAVRGSFFLLTISIGVLSILTGAIVQYGVVAGLLGIVGLSIVVYGLLGYIAMWIVDY